MGDRHSRGLDQAAAIVHRCRQHPAARQRHGGLGLSRPRRQTITFFTDRGIAYTLRVNDIPLTTGHGEPIQKQFAFEDQEHIVGVVCHDPRCLPDPSKHPQTPPRLVQRLFDVDADGDAADGSIAGATTTPTATARPRPSATSLRHRPDRGGQGLTLLAGPAGRGFHAERPNRRQARSHVQERPGGRSRGHRRIGKRLPCHQVGPRADLPGDRGQRCCRRGPRRRPPSSSRPRIG